MALRKDGYSWNGANVDADGIASFGPIRVYQEVVDCSAGGSSQIENLCTVPAGAQILNVRVETLEAFDGDTTTTFEVGVDAGSDNPDNYIDTSDFDPSAAVGTAANSFGGSNNDADAIATLGTAELVSAFWTNTASASAGKVLVQVCWLDLAEMGRPS